MSFELVASVERYSASQGNASPIGQEGGRSRDHCQSCDCNLQICGGGVHGEFRDVRRSISFHSGHRLTRVPFNISKAAKMVREADVIIYAIGIYDHYFNTMEEALGPSLLGQITTLTGGRTFAIDNPNDLPSVAKKIGVELRDQYLLGYRPPQERQDGEFHKIRVRMRVHKKLPRLRVYAKSGYYAAKQ